MAETPGARDAVTAAGGPEARLSTRRADLVEESLALAYRLVLERTEALVGHRFAGLHVIGGDTRNETLLLFTADAIGRPVWSSPTEATAIGHLLGQLPASGHIATLAEGRALVRESFRVRTYEPQTQTRGAWADAFHRFQSLGSI